jgi:hypothetical protein
LQEVIQEQKNNINKVLHTFISTDIAKMMKLTSQVGQVAHIQTQGTENRTVLWTLRGMGLPRTSWLTQEANSKTHLKNR